MSLSLGRDAENQSCSSVRGSQDGFNVYHKLKQCDDGLLKLVTWYIQLKRQHLLYTLVRCYLWYSQKRTYLSNCLPLCSLQHMYYIYCLRGKRQLRSGKSSKMVMNNPTDLVFTTGQKATPIYG